MKGTLRAFSPFPCGNVLSRRLLSLTSLIRRACNPAGGAGLTCLWRDSFSDNSKLASVNLSHSAPAFQSRACRSLTEGLGPNSPLSTAPCSPAVLGRVLLFLQCDSIPLSVWLAEQRQLAHICEPRVPGESRVSGLASAPLLKEFLCGLHAAAPVSPKQQKRGPVLPPNHKVSRGNVSLWVFLRWRCEEP